MQNVINNINKKFIPNVTKFINFKSIQAIKGGMFYTIPFMIIGSIFLIIADIIDNSIYNSEFIIIIKNACMQGYHSTFSISSLITTIGVSYTYAKDEKREATTIAITTLSLFILLNSYKIAEDETSAINILSAIIIGIFVPKLYIFIDNKTEDVKNFKSIPSGVVISVCKFIPPTIILMLGLITFSVFEFYFGITPFDLVYKFLQLPLQNAVDTLLFAIVIAFIVPFLWFFGIHGLAIVEALLMPIFIANTNSNAILLEKGIELTKENGAYIVTNQFLYLFINLGGAGITIGIAIYIYFFAKSHKLKEISKLSTIPALFNINEPILFGVPIVLNKLALMPFITASIISAVSIYLGQYFGIIPIFKPIMLHWTTPPIISGFIMGGWKLALLQFANIIMSFLAYLPLMKKIDYNFLNDLNEC